MNNLVKFFLLSLMISRSVFADGFSYKEVKEWHHDNINNIIKINSLEKKMDFAIDIISINEKKFLAKEAPPIKLPGLLINKPKEVEVIETKSLFSKFYAKDYKRNLTMLVLEDIDPLLLEKISREVKEALNFVAKDTLQVIKTYPPQTPIVQFKEIKSDAAAGLYENLVKKSFLIWILLMCGLTLYMLWEIRRIFNDSTSRLTDAISELKDKSAAEATIQDESSDKNNKPDESTVTSIYRDEFKPDTSVLVMNLFIAIRKHPGHLLASIYKVFDDQETLIKFFSFLDQSEVTDSTKKQKEVVLDFLKQLVLALNGLKIAAATVDITEKTRVISDVLTALKFLKINPKSEKIYQAVFFKARNRYYQVIEKLAEDYFEVMYLLFPDDLKTYMTEYRENMNSYSSRIMEILATGLTIEDIDDLQVQKFLNDVALVDLQSTRAGAEDDSFAKVLFYLSDEELTSMENDTNRSMIFKIPKIAWLKGSDRSILKNFITALNPQELKLFSENVNLQKIIKEFDPRTAYRINETLSSPIELNKNSWYDLRQKISKFYKCPVVQEQPSELANESEQVSSDNEAAVELPSADASQLAEEESLQAQVKTEDGPPTMKPLPQTPQDEQENQTTGDDDENKKAS